MLRNVLIAEDHEIVNISLRKALEEFGPVNTEYVYYCDDALSRIRKPPLGQPYDLLITDLHFEEDSYKQQLSSGQELIEAARMQQPDLKILVFSAEKKTAVIEKLFTQFQIDAYVSKARRDAQELRTALEHIFRNQKYFPALLRQSIRQHNSYNFSDFDITIISLLSQGLLQKDIPAYLQRNNIKPSGLSSVEKHLNKMREVLEFSKNEQLVAFCKDIGVI